MVMNDDTEDQVKRRIVCRYILEMAGELASVSVPLLTAPYAARVLGPGNIGIKSYTRSMVLCFALFGNMGIQLYGRKEISAVFGDKEKRGRIFWELAAVRAVIFIPVLAAYLCMCLAAGGNRHYFLALLPYLAAELFNFDWYLQGIGNYRMIALKKTAISLGGAFVLFAGVKKEGDLASYLLLTSLLSLMVQVASAVKMKKNIWKPAYASLALKRHIRPVIVYFFPCLAVSVYTVFDKVMLGMMCRQKMESGYYEYAAMLASVLKNAFLSLNTIVGTQINHFISTKQTAMARSIFLSFMKLVVGLAVPVSFGLAVVAEPLVCAYLGGRYVAAAGLIQIMAPVTGIVALSNCVAEQWVIPHGGIGMVNKATGMGAVLNVSLNALLIPRMKGAGAAAATLLAESVVLGLYLWSVRKEFSLWGILQNIYKYLLAGTAMFFLLQTVRFCSNCGICGIAADIAAGAAVYFLALVLLRDDALLSILDQIRRRKI